MKRKAFTLIELLGVIVIISIISTLLVVVVNDYIANTKKKAYEQTVENIEYLTRLYIDKERENISDINTIGTEIYITLQDLVDVDLIKPPIKDPRTGADITLDEQILIY